MNMKDVRKQAQWELNIEQFEEAVAKEKARLRQRRSFWRRLFPYRIVIVKR